MKSSQLEKREEMKLRKINSDDFSSVFKEEKKFMKTGTAESTCFFVVLL